MKILLVEDDKFIRDTFVERLRNNQYEVSSAKDGQEAVDKITADDFDVVITDIGMPTVSGVDVLKFAKKNKPKIKVIMMSAYADQKVINEAMKLGADEYIEKSSFLRDVARVLSLI